MERIKTNWLTLVAFITLSGILAISLVFTSSQPAHADPFPACDTRGILFQYSGGPPTEFIAIDMVTGENEPQNNVTGRTVNAIGYNVVDNFLYGWDNTANTLVRVHTDSSADELTVAGYGGTGGVIIGDVDENGHYWFIEGNGTNGTSWFQVDLNPGATFLTILNQGTVSGVPAGNTAGADWAYVPGGAGLYRITHDTGDNQGRLLVFDRSSGSFNDLGLVSDLPSTELQEGAFYADADGFLYATNNTDGNIYRVNITSAEATLFSNGPSSSGNDGARCANAHIPVDFGDAPSTYSTLLSDGGPRHSIAEYDSGNNTAPLMLGTKLDIETDGFPGTEANGDDTNNIDDEEGVTHIVATPGTPTALSIPVTVTNNTSDVATLAGWVDLDSNGTFDAGERVMQTVPANSGTTVYNMDFPTATFTDNSFARFRVFDPSVADPQPTGSATGGEVEDYLVQVGTYEVEKTSTPANGTTVDPGDTVTYTLDITNTGLTDLINLTLHDELVNVLDDASLVGSPTVEPASAGTATVDNDELQFAFTGDILAGQSVTITYSVQVNDGASLGDGVLRNMVVATHSNCHPELDGQTVTVSDPNCQTEHPVNVPPAAGLAPTGSNFTLLALLSAGLMGLSIAAYSLWRKRISMFAKA